jgi:hypothetical protein
MAAVVTFDPINLRIVEINTGQPVNELSILEVYSEWKDWLLADASRLGYPQAFRVVGGDPISDVASLGSTYFLVNGWRIRPAEYSHKLVLTGNIFTDPAGSDVNAPTLGSYNVTVSERVSNLTDSVLLNSPDIQYNSYNGAVTVDLLSANAGTEYPTGTPRAPVNNFADALTIANDRGFTTFFVIGNAALDAGLDFSGKVFFGENEAKSLFTIPLGATVTACEFREATIQGVLDGNSQIVACKILNLDYVDGFVHQCVLAGTVKLLGDAHLLDCWSGVPGVATPVIDFNGSSSALALRNYNGGIRLINKTGAESVSIDLNSGQIILDSTVTAGTIVCRGVGKLTNNAVGATVVDETLSTLGVAEDVWAHAAATDLAAKALLIQKILQNKTITDPSTGVMTVYDNDGSTVLLSANVYEGVTTGQAYRGQGANRRERLQ